MKRTTWVQMAAVLLSFILAAVARADVQLTFGVYASEKALKMVHQFRPILNALEKDLGRRLGKPVHIRLQVAKDYDQGFDDLVTGRVDFARLGPASYVSAKEADRDIEILAVERSREGKVLNALICVPEDSPIRSMEDLRGSRFAFGNTSSTSGRYLAQQYLMQHGIRASDLGEYAYLGRHDKVGTALTLGQYQAGALDEDSYLHLIGEGARLRVLARFQGMARPWLARAGLDERLKHALHASLLAMHDPVALKALNKEGFEPGNDMDYAIIREIIENNSAFFE